MKKILIILLLVFSVSCATTSTTSTRYDYITFEKAYSALATCDDTNGGRWWMNIGGMQVAVLQLSNCLGIENMLVMITDTNDFTSEIRYYSYKVLGLHFLEHISIKRPGKTWTLEQIREFDVIATKSEPGKRFVIYKINSISTECEGDVCERPAK